MIQTGGVYPSLRPQHLKWKLPNFRVYLNLFENKLGMTDVLEFDIAMKFRLVLIHKI